MLNFSSLAKQLNIRFGEFAFSEEFPPMVIFVVGFVPLTLIPSVESDHLGSSDVVDDGTEHEEEQIVDEGVDDVNRVLAPEDAKNEHDVCDDTVCPCGW